MYILRATTLNLAMWPLSTALASTSKNFAGNSGGSFVYFIRFPLSAVGAVAGNEPTAFLCAVGDGVRVVRFPRVLDVHARLDGRVPAATANVAWVAGPRPQVPMPILQRNRAASFRGCKGRPRNEWRAASSRASLFGPNDEGSPRTVCCPHVDRGAMQGAVRRLGE